MKMMMSSLDLPPWLFFALEVFCREDACFHFMLIKIVVQRL